MAVDEGTIRAYLESDGPRLVAALAVACGDRALAEEAVFDALARAWEADRAGTTIETLPAWVRTVAVRSLAKHRRRLGRQRRAVARLGVVSNPDPVGSVPGSVDLETAVAALSPRQRQVVALHYRLDLPVDDVATALGVSTGTVKTQLHRARTQLQARLADPSATAAPGGAH